MHPIDATNERRLAASGGSNERGGMIGSNFQIDVVKSLGLGVPGTQFVDLNSDTHLCRSKRAAPHRVTHGRDCRHNQNNQYERSCPGLPMPIVVRRVGVHIDLQW